MCECVSGPRSPIGSQPEGWRPLASLDADWLLCSHPLFSAQGVGLRSPPTRLFRSLVSPVLIGSLLGQSPLGLVACSGLAAGLAWRVEASCPALAVWSHQGAPRRGAKLGQKGRWGNHLRRWRISLDCQRSVAGEPWAGGPVPRYVQHTLQHRINRGCSRLGRKRCDIGHVLERLLHIEERLPRRSIPVAGMPGKAPGMTQDRPSEISAATIPAKCSEAILVKRPLFPQVRGGAFSHTHSDFEGGL